MITYALWVGVLTGFLYTFCAFSSILSAVQFYLRQGNMTGFMAGMGHATAQIVWIVIAISGTSLGADLLKAQISYYKFIAAALLFLLGIKIFFSSPTLSKKISRKNLNATLNAYFNVFMVALSAPTRIIGYLALFLLLGENLNSANNFMTKQMLAIGALLGIVIWWALFTLLMAKFNIKPTHSKIKALQFSTAFILILLSILCTLDL